MIEFEASYFFDKDKFDAKEEKAATSSNLREKRGKIGYSIFKSDSSEISENKRQNEEIKNITYERGDTQIILDNDTIIRRENYYILLRDGEVMKKERLTELVASDPRLYSLYTTVRDTREDLLSFMLRDEQLFNKLIRFFDKYIAEDYETRTYVLLTLFSAFTNNPLNLAVKAPTSEGKTYNVINIAKFFPTENVIILGSASPTSLIHDSNAILVDKDLNPIEDKLIEISQAIQEANKEEKKRLIQKREEILRDARYLVDLRNKALIFLEEPNHELWRKLRPILSHDQEFIEYRITDKSKSGRFRVKNVIIRGFPAVIYCTTRVEELGIEDELKSRFISVTTERKPEKYSQALEILSRWKMFGDLTMHQELEDDLIRDLILRIIKRVKTISNSRRILLPCFDEVLKSHLLKFHSGIILRRAKEITKLVELYTLIHAESRPKIKIDNVEYVLATMEDYTAVFKLLEGKDAFIEPYLLSLYEEIQKILNELGFATLKDIHEQLLKSGSIYTQTYLRRCLQALVSAGLIEKSKSEEDKRVNVYSLRNTPDQDYQGSKKFYNELNLEKYLRNLLELVSKEVEWQNGEKYLSVELIDPTEPYGECFQIDLSNIDGSLNVLLPPLKYIIFSNRSKKLQSEKEGNSSKKKLNIQYFHGISDNQSDKSGDQDSDKKLDAWDLENIIDTPSEQVIEKSENKTVLKTKDGIIEFEVEHPRKR
ncbi:MAG: hypothetical protein J7K36_05360 [Archaeoglobaceae archaeon]|nr:hypothetical protein [Archaeoglobaceae archaeon]